MSEIFKPNLAGRFDPAVQRFPALASPKCDGIRCTAMSGRPMSRSQKVLPNLHVQRLFAEHAEILQGLDGELIVGSVTADDVYRQTVSNVMADDKVFDFTYIVFDMWDSAAPFHKRLSTAVNVAVSAPAFVQNLPHRLIENMDELDAYEADCLAQGYEGIMLRDPNATYKQGRSSTREGGLLKVKRFEDSEAVIIGTEEEQFNGNEAQTNELGRTKRSTAKAGLVGKGTMGALIVRGINGPFKDVEFNVGTGFTAAQRAETWENGTIVTYKYFAIGTKDKPRHPVFKSRRDPIDMDAVA